MPVNIKELDFKTLIKKPLFWEIAVSVAVVLCALIFVLVALLKPASSGGETQDTTSNETTQSVTEATLPPPESNPIGMSDFYMDGDYLSCLATPSVLGIDISVWQGDIDWSKVKQAGVEFAMIRAGARGTEEGDLFEDSKAQANYAGAVDAGIKVGAYFFSQAITVEEAVAEANYLLEIIWDWDVQMPLVFDWEFVDSDARTGKMDPRTLTDCARAFCETVKNAGYTPMIYFNTNQSFDMLYLAELKEYDFWLAQYDTVLRYPYKIDMWQYSETGTVPGITGNVDINLYFPWEEREIIDNAVDNAAVK